MTTCTVGCELYDSFCYILCAIRLSACSSEGIICADLLHRVRALTCLDVTGWCLTPRRILLTALIVTLQSYTNNQPSVTAGVCPYGWIQSLVRRTTSVSDTQASHSNPMHDRLTWDDVQTAIALADNLSKAIIHEAAPDSALASPDERTADTSAAAEAALHTTEGDVGVLSSSLSQAMMLVSLVDAPVLFGGAAKTRRRRPKDWRKQLRKAARCILRGMDRQGYAGVTRDLIRLNLGQLVAVDDDSLEIRVPALLWPTAMPSAEGVHAGEARGSGANVTRIAADGAAMQPIVDMLDLFVPDLLPMGLDGWKISPIR